MTQRNDAPDAEERTEEGLLRELREAPLDEGMREVYADFLEQHGHSSHAEFLRTEAAGIETGADYEDKLRAIAKPVDVPWRAIVARPKVERCIKHEDGVEFAYACPKRWDTLRPTTDDLVRHCDLCARSVYFCTSPDEARLRGKQGDCIAIDAALSRAAALVAYDEGLGMRNDRPILLGRLSFPELDEPDTEK